SIVDSWAAESWVLLWLFFFFQAEDGIRDGHVTGVQTCALPISLAYVHLLDPVAQAVGDHLDDARMREVERVAGAGVVDVVALLRSEERRVGKECRSRWWAEQ